MTISQPVNAGNWLFWSTFEEYVTPTFVLQKYNGPIWWTEKYRILMLIDGVNNNGYQIAFSGTKEDIVANWEIIVAVYQDKVEKTGLARFSETYLLNLMKKLAKKMLKLEELNNKRLKMSSDSALVLPISNIINNKLGDKDSLQQSQKKDASPCSSHSSLTVSYSYVMPSNKAIVNTMNESNKSSIKLGDQRRIATLFTALYHIDPITILERTYAKKFEDDEWVEWVDERTGMRPIHIAVEKMDIALIKYLLDKNADVNIKDIQGWSPLHFASYAGNLDICHLLIEQGNAAVLSISKDGTLPLHYLARHSFDKSQSNKFLQILQLLLDKGTPIDAKTIRGETALHRAAFFGSLQVLNFLIDQKANLNIQNVRGETPLYFAVIGRHKQIVTLLVENGSDCNLGGSTGSALEAARKTGQSDLFFFLSGFSKSLDPFDYNDNEDEVEIESDIANNELNNSSLDNIKQLQQEKLEKKIKEKSEKLAVNHENFYPHTFVFIDFRGPTWCSLCGYFMWGIRKQGFSCEVCGYCVHPKCKKKATLTEPCEVAKQMNCKDKHKRSGSIDQFLSTSKSHIEKPLHKQTINRKRLESLYNQFNSLDKEQHGCLYKKEFGECLGSLISDSELLSDILFQAFDSNHDGKMDLKDFLQGVSVLQNSSQEEQIFFAFQMLDRTNRGYITLGELRHVLQSIYQSLANLKINSIKPDTLIQYIFPTNIVYKEIKEEIKQQPKPFSKAMRNSKLVKSLSSDSRIGLHRVDDSNNNSLDSINTTTTSISFIKLRDDNYNYSNQSTPHSSMGSISTSPIESNPSLPKTDAMEIAQIEKEVLPSLTTDDIEPSTSDQTDGRLRSSCIKSLLNKPLLLSQSLPVNADVYINSLNNSINNSLGGINNSGQKQTTTTTTTYSTTTTTKSPPAKKYSTEINLESRIFYDDYKQAMMKHCNFIQSLGLVELDDNTKQEHTEISKWMRFEGKEITLGHENWETMQYIMIGIRRAIGETMTLTNRPLKQKDYDVIVEFKYNEWVFKDFSPFPFKKIRDKLDIDPMHFMFSLGPEKIFGNLLLGNLSHVCEVVTSGRSGSMFFRSNEGRYLIKTIPPNEELVLKSILPSYVQHLLKYPNSLLTKTLGCYNMITKNKDLRFIVMNNLFFTPLPIHEKYDLKGSTIGRHVELQEGENDGVIADISLKDLDFKRTLNIGPEFKAPLMEQIEHDTKLLESHNICDYSLLVGVHRVDEYSPIALASDDVLSKDIYDILDDGFFKMKSTTSLFHQHYGGILSSDKREVYFIAIIDTLTTWNYKKKYENMFKSLVHDASQISAIDPSSYRARFQRLVQQIVQ